MRINLPILATVLLAGSALLQPASAGIIDIRPPDARIGADLLSGPDTYGGTFFADASLLESFTLNVEQISTPGVPPGGTFRAVVLATSSGTPVGPALWASAETGIPSLATDIVFSPGISLSVGSEYFIGVDTGVFTTTAGGDFSLGIRTDNPIAGQRWINSNGAGFTTAVLTDVASRIVMTAATTAAPEPATVVLLGLGLTGLWATARKR